MTIIIPEDEYPALTNYLSNAKTKMKFLYLLEELFEKNQFDPVREGFVVVEKNVTSSTNVDLGPIAGYFDSISKSLEALNKNLDGACIGRFPVEHVIHEVAPQTVLLNNKAEEEEEEDFSDTTGIDFASAIAAFDD